jgi:large subunit ribosomal protein L21
LLRSWTVKPVSESTSPTSCLRAKGDKITVFKKRRRHNYRRKQGHRQQQTILRIVAIGDQKAEGESKPAKAAKTPKPEASIEAAPAPDARGQTDVGVTENPAPEAAAKPKKAAKPAPNAAESAETGSTNETAPATGAAKKAPKAK